MDTVILRAALQYLAWGLPVLPICSSDHEGESKGHLSKCSSPGKSPVVKGWSTIEYATNVNTDLILRAFKTNPSRNIGLPLGVISGFVGIDIDGDLGELYLSRWSKNDLPPTVQFYTSGGRRLLYRIPERFTPKKNVLFKTDGGGHEELALLGQGQQTVLPPSLHVSGRKYKYEEGRGFHNFKRPQVLTDEQRQEWLEKAKHTTPNLTIDDIPYYDNIVDLALIPIAPNWMLDALDASTKSSRNASYEDADDSDTMTDTVSPEEWSEDIPQGGRHDKLIRLTGSLIRGFISDPYYTVNDAISTMIEHNRAKCKPPEKDQDIVRMVRDVWESEQKKNNRRRIKFVPITVTRQFIAWAERQGTPVRYVGSENTFFQYQLKGKYKGTWKPLLEVEMNYQIGIYLSARDTTWYTTSKVNEVTTKLKDVLWTMFPESAFLFDIGNPARNEWLQNTGYDPYTWIATEECMVNWKDGTTCKFDYKFYTLTKMRVKYNTKAVAPMWQEALNKWVDYDHQQEFLQQYAGSLLIPIKIPQVLYLIGEGANGKSLFAETLSAMFQSEFTARSNFAQLMERFGLYDLKNKMLNVCTDESTKWLKDTGSLKAAVAGEPVRAEIKMQQFAPTIYPACKFIVCSNHYPYTSDKSYGWLRRLSFVSFPHNFIHEYTPEQRAKFEERFKEAFDREASGRLNWMLEGLRMLASRNFKLPESDPEANKEYQIANDDVAAFFEEVFEIPEEGGYWIHHKYVEKLFRSWCELNNSKIKVKPVELTRRFKMMGIKKQGRKAKVGKNKDWKSVYAYVGLKLQDNIESEQVTKITYHDIPIEQLGPGALTGYAKEYMDD